MKSKSFKTYNFDWDDNILFMPTHIILFHKETNEELPISTQAYAKERSNVSKSGPYENYKVIYENELSYREFRDDPKGELNYFAEAVKKAIANKTFGPSWEDFCEALATESSAAHVTIITARGHAPEQMMEALKFLQSEKLIQHLPALENIFPVSYPKLDPAIKGHASTPSEAKKKILERILDNLNERGENFALDGKPAVILAGFSDDDEGTVKIVKEHFEEAVNRWPYLRLNIYNTNGHQKRCLKLRAKNPIALPTVEKLTKAS